MPENFESADEKVIIIGGYSRTGTTMVQGLVCCSPETIGVSRECVYLRTLFEAYYQGLKYFNLYTYDYFATPEGFVRFHKRIINDYLRQVRKRFGSGIIVQKEPTFTEYFPLVPAILSKARFIVMVRDIRDTMASQYKRAEKNGWAFDLTRQIDRYVHTYRNLFLNRKVLSKRCALLRYEALCRAPDEVLPVLGNFLDFKLEDGPGKGDYAVARKRGDESSTSLDGQPPKLNSIGRYADILSNKALGVLDSRAKEIDNLTKMRCMYAHRLDQLGTTDLPYLWSL